MIIAQISLSQKISTPNILEVYVLLDGAAACKAESFKCIVVYILIQPTIMAFIAWDSLQETLVII
jgi:hypothetical protein